MFERYTERGRRVLFYARYEASRLGNSRIEPDHLLLGLVREKAGLSWRMLSVVPVDEIVRDAETRLGGGQPLPTSVEIPFSEAAKQVLRDAADEADRLGHNYIGTEHLLLGLMRDGGSSTATALALAGLQLESARDHLKALLAGPADERAAADLPEARAHLEVGVGGVVRVVAGRGTLLWDLELQELAALAAGLLGADAIDDAVAAAIGRGVADHLATWGQTRPIRGEDVKGWMKAELRRLLAPGT